MILIKKQGDLNVVKITRNKAVQEYYNKHQKRIDKVLGAVGNQTITPKQKFEALAYAHTASRFASKAEANNQFDKILDTKEFGQDYADTKAMLKDMKREGRRIDLRKKKYNVSKFSAWVDLPDDTYLLDRDYGDWNGGSQMREYVSRYSVNKEANIVLYYGYGAIVNGTGSPYEFNGTMTVEDMESILGYEI